MVMRCKSRPVNGTSTNLETLTDLELTRALMSPLAKEKAKQLEEFCFVH